MAFEAIGEKIGSGSYERRNAKEVVFSLRRANASELRRVSISISRAVMDEAGLIKGDKLSPMIDKADRLVYLKRTNQDDGYTVAIPKSSHRGYCNIRAYKTSVDVLFPNGNDRVECMEVTVDDTGILIHLPRLDKKIM